MNFLTQDIVNKDKGDKRKNEDKVANFIRCFRKLECFEPEKISKPHFKKANINIEENIFNCARE